ncbi:MAG TPA: two-component regulator propeller domain-containing protein [Bryobacteraceae bacterium]|nr:two-component regulator propeller domain-containing protein [Bryobacteraceae bacterium]
MKGRAAYAPGMFLACCAYALALNPDLDVSQYAHTSWKIRDGFPKGQVNSIAQTPDGWLWLGTEFGLVRFDGVTPSAFQPPRGQHLPSDNIRGLLVARDGTLWIGTTKGLASWKNGSLTRYAELGETFADVMLEDREGTVWVGLQDPGKLCAIRGGRAQCEGEGRLGPGVFGLHESRDGSLWVGVINGLWKWKPGPARFYPVPGQSDGIHSFADEDTGALTFGTRSGLMRIEDAKSEPYVVRGVTNGLMVDRILRDRDGGLWVGTRTQGLVHLHKGRADAFGQSEGLSGDDVFAFLEDREGNLWISTTGGLDRFRNYAAATFSEAQGLSKALVGAVLADKDGSVWIVTLDGLNRWKRGEIAVYRTGKGRGTQASSALREIAGTGLPDRGMESLFQDTRGRVWVAASDGIGYLENDRFTLIKGTEGLTHAFAQDAGGNVWVAHQQLGLLRLSTGNQMDRIPLPGVPPKSIATSLLADPARGDLWIGFYPGGLARYRDGQMRAYYGAAEGLGEGQVAGLRLDSDGTLWADTAGGLSRLRNGHVTTLNGRNGLPCDAVHWSMEDDAHALWLYMPCGLVRIARSEVDAWNNDTRRSIRFMVFDSSDGIRTVARPGGFTPHASKSPDGKIWFAVVDGVSVVDPLHLPFNKLPPPVDVEQVTADGKVYDASNGLRLPALVRDVWIDYTSLSLVSPEKAHFRYKLEGQDREWKEVVNDREARYSNLAPRRYRFRVQASNNSGVWNEAGASFDFSIDPAWYQTLWFGLFCIAAFFALLWALYRYRLHQIAQQFNQRLEGRVEERTRVARELHDTLLQSFQGLMLRLQVVDEMLPPGKAKDEFERTLERADQAIVEGREAVHGLRSSTTITNGLSEAVKHAGDELAAQGGAEFRLVVEGATRELRPIVRDEIYRISREALRNAFQHAHAHRIEAEITYGDRALRLRIRDDGNGIPPSILKAGRESHYGLTGMRERTVQIGAKLNIWSRVGAGTEVDLSIPGSIAYAETAGRAGFKFFRRKAG